MTDAETIDRVIRARRSVRAFSMQAVTRGTLEELLDVARWAPSGSNSQPWRVTAATGAVAEALRARLAAAVNERPMTPEQSAAFARRVAAGPMAWLLDHVQEPVGEFLTTGSMTFYGAPVALVVSYPGAPHASVPDGVPAFVTTLLLAAEAHGLGTIWLGWPMGRPEILREELGIPAEEQLGAFVALGYPDREAIENRGRSPRAPVGAYTRWLGWE